MFQPLRDMQSLALMLSRSVGWQQLKRVIHVTLKTLSAVTMLAGIRMQCLIKVNQSYGVTLMCQPEW